MKRETLEVRTEEHTEGRDITRQVAEVVSGSGVSRGWCEVFVPHTTAAVTVNEAADPEVMRDIMTTLDRLVPWTGDYRHLEGNSAAHVKSVLLGAAVRLPVESGRLDLGTWQGIFFMEFDGPRRRKVLVEVSGR